MLLIGAYRDNEVHPAHPLIRKLDAIRHAAGSVHQINLSPLAPEDLVQLVAEALHCGLKHADPLAQLVHEKTAGNPFFAIQFVSALVDERLVAFNHDERQWSWDVDCIRAKGFSDNVVDLMVAKLNRLPIEAQRALLQLACLGNSAEFSLLQIVSQDSIEEIHRQIWEAVRAGLVVRAETSYRFVHDRVQEAAYSLIPESSRAEMHLRIGRLLAANTPPDERNDKIFEIVNQLNRSAHLITLDDERKRAAEFNFIAARRAKLSTAYVSALSYLASRSGTSSGRELEHGLRAYFFDRMSHR